MNILVIEDEQFLGEHLKKSLEDFGFNCQWFQLGAPGLESASVDSYDCILIDRRLPDMEGLEICKNIRNQGISTPIIILTSLADVDEKVKGLNVGADDYMTKPFVKDELIARMNAVIRRTSLQRSPSIRLGDVELNPINRTVVIGEEMVAMSNREFLLLQYLMLHPGRPLTRRQIFDHVWESESSSGSNVVDVYINYIRKKIDFKKDRLSHIETVRGYGYRFIEK